MVVHYFMTIFGVGYFDLKSNVSWRNYSDE